MGQSRFAGATDPQETTVVSSGQYAQEQRGSLGTSLTEMFVGGCLDDPGFDAALVSSRTPDPGNSTQFLAALEAASARTGKPVVFSQPTITAITEEWHQFKDRSSLAFIAGVGRAAAALQAAADYHERQPIVQSPASPRKTQLSDELRTAILGEIAEGKNVAGNALTRGLLEAYGLPLVQQALVADADAAGAFADKVGYPVVVKLPKSDDATHMTEVGGVRVGLRDRSEVADAVRELLSLQASGDGRSGVVVQQMVRDGTEIYFGGSNPGFGYPPAVLVGLGGIFVEATRDVAMSLAPIDAAEARSMIERLRAYKVLTGFRGRGPVDIDAIVDGLTRLSGLVLDLEPFFDELDINPALVLGQGQGMQIVDAVLTYRQATAPDPSVEPVAAASKEGVAS